MANKTILSTVYNNQQLLLKITSGLNVKSNAISSAVSGILSDYDSLKGATAGIATTLLDLSVNTKNAIDTLSAADTGIIDTRIKTAKTNLTETINATSSVLKTDISTLSGQVKDAFGDGANVIVSKDGGITKSNVTIGNAVFADTPLSTTLATEAAVIHAISTTAINLVGHEAIGVSGDLDKTAYLKIDGNDHVLTQSDTGLKTTIGLSAINPTSATFAKSYCLVGVNGQQLGDVTIDIPKDQFLSGTVYDSTTKKLTLVFYVADGTTTSTTIDLGGLVDVYNAGSGIYKTTIDGHDTFVGVVDANSENYLTVGTDGFKLTGINTAINTAVNTTSTILSSAIGAGFDSANTVKSYIDTAASNEAIARTTAISNARTDLSAYVDAVSGNLTTYITTEITNINTGTAALSGRVDILEDTISGTNGLIGQLTTEISDRKSAITSARTDLSAYVDAVSGTLGTNINTLNTNLTTEISDRKSAITQLSGTISGNYVTKEVFGDIASNTKAENEALATKYETLQTKLNTLLENI